MSFICLIVICLFVCLFCEIFNKGQFLSNDISFSDYENNKQHEIVKHFKVEIIMGPNYNFYEFFTENIKILIFNVINGD